MKILHLYNVFIHHFIDCGKLIIRDPNHRLGTYSGPTVPPAAMVATKAMALDPRAEPLYSERVPFVVSISR